MRPDAAPQVIRSIGKSEIQVRSGDDYQRLG
jgi:hypothetical protein